MNRCSLFFITIGLISIIVVSSVIAYELGFTRPGVPSILWQHPIENFANSLAADNGKVFMADNSGNINCFDSQNGESIWNGSARKGFPSSGLAITGGKVYVGFQDRQVGCLDENTGQLLWTFQNEQAPNRVFGGSPQIVVKNGILFAITDTISAHNATTGDLLWQAIYGLNGVGTIMQPNNTWTGGSVTGYPLNGDPFDSNYVYATGGNYSSMYFFKLNTDTGQVLWNSSVTWDATPLTFGLDYNIFAPQVLATTQEQVIMEKTENVLSGSQQPTINQLFSLNSSTGQELWSLNVTASIYNPTTPNIYNPTVYDNLLFFSASDGNLYALTLANGTIAWKTKVDTQNFFSLVNSTVNSMYILSPNSVIDSQNQKLFWSFGVNQGGESGNYTATICSLDLVNGNVTWTKQIEDTWLDSPSGGLAVNNGKLFLTENAALWIFNTSTGELVQTQQFDHYILSPVVLGNETFVAADLWLFAYA